VPQLSIVVNYLGQPQPLETTLVSVLENRPADCEIIVVHDGSYSDPYDLEGEVSFVYAQRGSTNVDMANAGLHAASGKIVHLLVAGWSVTANWWRAGCQPLLDCEDVATVAPLVVDGQEPTQPLSLGLQYRGWRRQVIQPRDPLQSMGQDSALRNVIGPSMAAGFYRREDVLAAGRFRNNVGDDLADVDLALTLHHAGLRCVVATDCVVHGTAESPFETASFRKGLFQERLFWRHAPFLGWRQALVGYPWQLASDWLQGFWSLSTYKRLLGRVRGCLEKGEYESFREQAAHFQHLRRRKPTTRRLNGRLIRVDGSHQEQPTDDPSVRVDAK